MTLENQRPTCAAAIVRWFALAALCSIPLYATYRLRHTLPYDDAFITFTYARNVARGVGFVYNGGAPYLGTTTPLLTLLLAALSRLLPGIEIYVIALWTGAVCWVSAGVVAYLFGQRISGRTVGLAMAGLHATAALFPHVLGSEYPLLVLLCLLSLYLASQRRDGLTGLALGLAFLTRGDAAILAALIGLVFMVQDRRLPWRLTLGFLISVMPWLIYGFMAFGNPLPATLAVKRAHRAIGAWPSLVEGFQQWLGRTRPLFRLWLAVLTALAALGFGLSVWRRNIWGVVAFLWGVFYAVAYAVLDTPFYLWYSIPLVTSLTLGAGTGLGLLAAQPQPAPIEPSMRRRLRRSLPLVGGLLLGGIMTLGAVNLFLTVRILNQPSARSQAYVDAGSWLATNTPPGSTVAFIEVGWVGYFSDRQVIDLLGLTTSGTEPYLMRRDHAGLLAHFQPDYYIRNTAYDDWGMNLSVHESVFFQSSYVPVAEIQQPGSSPVLIYRRRVPAE